MASGTYKATGINLKSAPLGESDRLLTILTEEYGLLRAVAPGSRKYKSSLGGRSSLFVVNQLLIAKGRNLDKVIQAESLESYPGLSQDLSKLTASQYLAELVLCQALSDQSQADLFHLLRQQLSQLEQSPSSGILPCLAQSMFHLLAIAGLAPQVQSCCVTQRPISPNFTDPDWRVGFSITTGGIVSLSAPPPLDLSARLTATELQLLQQLPAPHSAESIAELSDIKVPPMPDRVSNPATDPIPHRAADRAAAYADPTAQTTPPGVESWLAVERVLRHYAQYHFDRPIRSAALIDLCFVSVRSLSQPTP
ncbi:DNA repair protein RecO [Egbenema bharatensis]|uniref:DNA repair protein RecO n=1 Tax=Egbenema bharatensis TaxID=3463334 RepID=UPI003A89272A